MTPPRSHPPHAALPRPPHDDWYTPLNELYALFIRQARLNAERTAVRDEHGSLTYGQLLRRSTALAAALRHHCPAPGQRIGLHLRRTADVLTGVLAVTAAGHTYVPLDPAYPAQRLGFVAEDSALSLIISDQDLPEALAGVPELRLDRTAAPPSAGDAAEPAADVPADPGAIAYVIYTSGTTGRPKGVEVPCANVAAMVTSFCARHTVTPDDVWTLFHSYSFDFSVWEMWGALATGGCLVVVPAHVASSPRATVDLLVREQATVVSIVPSVFRHLVTAAGKEEPRPEGVRRIIFGGESVDAGDIRRWRQTVSRDCEFVNTYGITETTVFVSSRVLTPEEVDAPASTGFDRDLGRPLDGWEIAVLDEQARPVRPGETGEIWVAGAGVAAGYLGLPELTAERFRTLTLPPGGPRRHYRSGDLATRTADDVFCFAGRADDQVKINGFRIELGEIETALRRLRDVRDAAVVCGSSRVGGQMLTAYYVADEDVTAASLTGHLAGALPRHMVPSRFVRLAELPLNPSGKTDRRALAERGPQGREAPVPPPTRNAISDPERAGFLEELYQGRFRWDLIRDFPAQTAADRAHGDAFVEELSALLHDRIDPDLADREGRLPEDFLPELAKRGYFRLQADAGADGHALSHFNLFRVVEAAARGCMPVAMSLALENTLGAGAFATLPLPAALRDLVREHAAAGRFSASADTEPEGAGNQARSTTATPVDGGAAYLLNGVKLFAGHAPVAELVGVSATVRENGRDVVREFFVPADAPGVSAGVWHEYMGIRGFPNGWFRFDDVRVPREHMLVEPDTAHQVRMTQTTSRLVTRGRLHMQGAPSLAAARLCTAWSREFVNRRTIDGRPLGEHREIQARVAQTLADTFAIETVCQWCLLPEDQGTALNVRFEQNMAKNVVSLLSWQVVDRTMALLAAEGYETAASKARRGVPAWPLERLMRDIRSVRVSGGVDFQIDNWIARMSILSYYYPEPAQADELMSPTAPGDLADPRLTGRNAGHLRWVADQVHAFGRRCLTLARTHQDKDALLEDEPTLIRLTGVARELMVCALVLARAATSAEAGDSAALPVADVHCTEARHRVADLLHRLDTPDAAPCAQAAAAWPAGPAAVHPGAEEAIGSPDDRDQSDRNRERTT
ncbi:Dimodular nonribosomal peptide synthase [Streptomyces sp. YIM 121038]|nr:Dimodular nonribosomal peptide synthase [Streptomyces sp. YIM 121038]